MSAQCDSVTVPRSRTATGDASRARVQRRHLLAEAHHLKLEQRSVPFTVAV